MNRFIQPDKYRINWNKIINRQFFEMPKLRANQFGSSMVNVASFCQEKFGIYFKLY
ncbi:MAG: hypothetical protein JZU53_14975 [Paludibacter sp.]|nr:hypothetical protein [Paludibacter sp.]